LTRAYHQAEIGFHIALFIPVLYATADLLFVLFLLLPILANLIVWVLITFFVMVFAVVLIALISGLIRL